MKLYNKEELSIMKNVIYDYDKLSKDIKNKVEKGYDIEMLIDYIRHLSSCNTTNINLQDDLKYVDFNYQDMLVTIYQQDDEKPYLGDTIEVYNDKGLYMIDVFNNINEIRFILNGNRKKEMN